MAPKFYSSIRSFVVLVRFSVPWLDIYSRSSILMPNFSLMYMPGSRVTTWPAVRTSVESAARDGPSYSCIPIPWPREWGK